MITPSIYLTKKHQMELPKMRRWLLGATSVSDYLYEFACPNFYY